MELLIVTACMQLYIISITVIDNSAFDCIIIVHKNVLAIAVNSNSVFSHAPIKDAQ